jgi:hypothetical protein
MSCGPSVAIIERRLLQKFAPVTPAIDIDRRFHVVSAERKMTDAP